MSKLYKVMLTTTLLALAAPAYADPFDWIYGLSEQQAVERLERQGFSFVREEQRQGNQRFYLWHRRAFCVRFRSVDRVVADATEIAPRNCKLKDDGDDYY